MENGNIFSKIEVINSFQGCSYIKKLYTSLCQIKYVIQILIGVHING